ncbi:PKD domain-containing protein [Algoriphagus terrigena]|uniref:PKD domain-containing protein n=1 Tax=Algoriphagus terrigena TaxID=344884 RepID=UPI001B7FBDCE|nr:PKD domain-containing protein [Algoriphagus terrigena]
MEKSNIKTRILSTSSGWFGYRLIFLCILSVFCFQQSSIAQVEIPREGFPYCEPFTGSGPFENTIIKGNIRNNATGATGSYTPTATGQSLQLTPNLEWHNGYVIVDIPFSSQFGVKTSFEYYTYGNMPFEYAADGIGFFMFDADEPVNIGWLGGSLGYAPFVNLDGTVDPGKNGIKGGYLGIGLDEWGNFAVGTVGQPLANWESKVRNSITIRSPEANNYDVYHRFVTTPDSNAPTILPDLPPNRYFPIDHKGPNRVTDCNQPGYRKVFIELIPSGVGYQIKIDMLVNHTTFGAAAQHISFPPVNYPFPAPPRLKIGFTGATGGWSNFHEIANVTVNVSDVANISEPGVPDQNETLCVNEGDLDMEFKVDLATSDAFVTCLQLFNSSPGAPHNAVPSTDFGYCGLDNSLCVSKCNPSNYTIPVYDASGNLAGTFYSELQDLNTGNFNQLRDVVNVRFEPAPGFSGEAKVYYNVTDNYGLTSEPGIITVTANPFPVINPAVTVENPSCDGQEDGSLSGLTVSSLVPDFDYEWLFNGTSIGKAGATHTYSAGTGVFALQGLNLGTYTLNVWNPSSSGGCYETHDVVINQENGTPVELDADSKAICEGEAVSFLPSIDNLYNPSGASPQFSWYLNANRAGGALVNGSTVTIDGNPVQVNIQSNGEITLTGLKYSGPGAIKTYTFYVEAKDQSTPTGNFCPFLGDVLISATVEIHPPLDFTVSNQDDWCLTNSGSVTARVTGVTGPLSYTLEDESGNALATNATGNFTSLSAGNYSVYASTSFCNTAIVDVTIEGPSAPLQLAPIATINSYCSLPNGTLEFSIQGGNTPYQSITVDGSPVTYQPSGIYQVDGLAAKNYAVRVVDREGCEQQITMNVAGDPSSNFSVLGTEICEGFPATVVIDVNQPSTSTPDFKWYYQDAAGDYVLITDGLQVGDLQYSIDANLELTIDGLKANAIPYKYFLNVTGDRVCDQGYIPAEVEVNEGPTMTAPLITQISCFGADSGVIQAQIPSGNLASFEFSLTGDNGVNLPFAANNGLYKNLSPGVYELIIRRSDGCTSTISDLVITEPPLIEPSLISMKDPTCGLFNGEAVFEISGGTGAYTVLINGKNITAMSSTQTGNSFQLKDLEPGTYSLAISDENGCTVDYPDFLTLTNDPGIIVDLDPLTDEACFGDDVQLSPTYTTSAPVKPVFDWYKDQALSEPIEVTSTPVAGSPSYQIAADGTLTVSGLDAGSRKYYLEISGPGVCTFVREANVTVYPPIEGDVTVTNETCFGAADGTLSVVPKGGNGTFEFSINGSPFAPTSSYTDLAPGPYKLQIRNDIGCEVSYDLVIEGPAAPVTINTPDLLRASCDLENGSIENLQISGGWGDYQVEWRKGSETGAVIPGTLTGTTDLGPDTYFALVSDGEGCQEVFSFVIEESSDPVYNLVNPIDVCAGEPLVIRPIHLAPDPSLPPTAFTEVKWYKEPGQTGQITNGADAQNPSISYTIDDSDWLNPQLQVDNLPAGTHDFYFFVECTGQEIKADVRVYEIPQVVFNTTPVVCFGDTNGKLLIESGALPEYLYSINKQAPINEAALLAQNLAAGTYSIEVTSPAGCPQLVEVTIESPTSALAISDMADIDPGCGASNGKIDALISGGWSPYSVTLVKNGVASSTFASSNGILSIVDLATGLYHFEVTDAQGCQIVTDPVELVDGPTQILIDDLEICSGEDAVFAPTLDPTASGATYHWTFDAAGAKPIVSGSTVGGATYQIGGNGVLTVSGLATSNTAYTYYLTASGGGVCVGFVAEAKVRVFNSPSATASVTDEICYGEGGEIQVNASGGSGSYTYSLNGQPDQTSNVFQVPVGTYTIRVNTPQGCFIELTGIEVTGPSAPLEVTNLNQANPTCSLANGEISFTVVGGYPGYSVDIINDGVNTGAVQADASGNVVISGISSAIYQFEISDAEGCTILLDEPLDLVEVPTEIVAEDQRLCEGEVAQILPSVPTNTPSSFSWYFDSNESQPISSGTSNGVTYSISSSGELTVSGLVARDTPYTYYVMAAGPGICAVELKPVNIYVSSIPTLRVSNPSVVCDPSETVDLTNFIEGFNPTLYDYDVVNPDGSALRLDQLAAVDVTGDYRVSSSLKGANCWNEQLRIKVIISDSLLVAKFQYAADIGDGTIVTNDKVQILEPVQFQDLTVGRAIVWNWDFGDGAGSSSQNPSHTYTQKGTYTVRLSTIDEFGCQSEFVMQLLVTDEYKVMVPNAFTPGGQKNQYFKPIHRGISAIDFYVFNTWGELIYNSTDLEDIGWDGTLNGKNVPNGNYVYKVKYQARSGDIHELSGVFVLIR